MAIRLDEKTVSDLPIPPGEVLGEEIEALGMSQKQLAAALGRPVQAVNEIIRGKKAITEETALGLERVLGIGAHVWVGLESAYRMALPATANGNGWRSRSVRKRGRRRAGNRRRASETRGPRAVLRAR